MNNLSLLSVFILAFLFLCSMSNCEREFSFNATFGDNVLSGRIKIYIAEPTTDQLTSIKSGIDINATISNALSNLKIDIMDAKINGADVAVTILEHTVEEKETDVFAYVVKFITQGFNEPIKLFRANGRIVNDVIKDGILELYESTSDNLYSRIILKGHITGSYIKKETGFPLSRE